jgi:hypothetical protein
MPDGAASLRPAALRAGRWRWMTRLTIRGLWLRAVRRQPHRPDRFRRFGRMEAPWAPLAQRLRLGSRARTHATDFRRQLDQAPLSITHLSQIYPTSETAQGEAARGHRVVEVTRAGAAHLLRSRVFTSTVHRLRVTEHARSETITNSSVRDQVELLPRRVIATEHALPLIMAKAPVVDRASQAQKDSEPPISHNIAPAAANPPAGPEFDIERITDQVLWRIERRVIAQRERLGKV